MGGDAALAERMTRKKEMPNKAGKSLVFYETSNNYQNNVFECHVLVAQGIARWTSNPEVAGSNPAEDAQYFLSEN